MAVNLNRIYTKTGDAGTTRLVGGVKIHKGDMRLECYGTCDELNCHLGVIRTLLEELPTDNALSGAAEILKRIQNELFDMGSVMATPPEKFKEGPLQVTPDQIEFLENTMDGYLQELKPLKSFTLPGGSRINAEAHLARAVCRRLERLLWRTDPEIKTDPNTLIYINRLSDFLFVFSRWCVKREGKAEVLWEPGKK